MGRLVPYFALLVEALAFYRQVLFYGGYAIPYDLQSYHLPIAEFLARSLRSGELPLWNPFTYCGTPIYANLTAQLFYPPAVFTLWLSNLAGGEDLLYFLEWQIVLHVFLGGVFTYWLLRKLGTTRAAALLAGTIFQLGGFFASQTQHLGATNAAAWLPLAWLAVVSLAARLRWRWAVLLAASFAMSILAGFPAVAAVVIGSSLLLAVVLALSGRARKKLVWAALAACAGAAALAAIQVLPTAELTALSVARMRGEWMGTGGGLRLESLVSLVLPNYYGIFDLATYNKPWQPTFLYLYAGIPGLALAGMAALARRTEHAPVFGWLTALAACWMLGDSTAAGRAAIAALPDIAKSAMYPEFAMAAFLLGVAVLAGLGMNRFFRSGKPVLGAALVVLAAFDLTMAGSGRPMNTGPLEKEPGLTRDSFDGSREVLNRVRLMTRRSRPPDRVDTIDDSMDWAMGAALTEVPTANGNDPFALTRVMEVRRIFTGGERWGRYYQVVKPGSPVLDLVNVRYLLTRKPLDAARAEAAGLQWAGQLPGRVVYENPDVLPRFFLVSRVRQAGGMEEAAGRLGSAEFRVREEAVVEGAAAFEGAGSGGRVRVRGYTPRRVALEVESEGPAFLVTSETYYPGWRAYVDGAERPLALTNVAFRGLFVPEGKHVVEMRFEPAILWRSALVSLAAWLAAMAGAAFGDNRRKRWRWISSNT